ncbi:Uncharacterised protein [Mycobacterium tuberculosis]|nr:Uncharacterised protein [Mycobacterium tuberculosis]
MALAVLPAVRVGPEGSSAVPQESAALTVSVARAAQAVPVARAVAAVRQARGASPTAPGPLAFPAPKAWPARPASAGRRRACRSRGAGLKPRARDCTPTRRLGRTTARARAQRAESSSSSFGLGHAMETLEAGRRYLC